MKYKFIILITDFGYSDNFVGVMKGVIYKINPKIKILDLTHNVQPQNIIQALFLLKYSYEYMPKNSIFLSVIDPGVGSKRDIIIAKHKKLLFIAPDNGILSFLPRKGTVFYKLNTNSKTFKKYFTSSISNTFHGRDIFAPLAAYLSNGIALKKLCILTKKIKSIKLPAPKIFNKILKGKIIYIDNFGNAITNIDKKTFEKFLHNQNFTLKIKRKSINKLSHAYSEEKNIGIIFNSFNLLEIFFPFGNVSEKLKIKIDDEVKISIKK